MDCSSLGSAEEENLAGECDGAGNYDEAQQTNRQICATPRSNRRERRGKETTAFFFPVAHGMVNAKIS